MLTKLGRWIASGLGYLLFTLAALGLCLWLLFPKDGVHRLLVRSLNAALPEAQWRVGSVAFAFPLAVRLERIEGYARDDDAKPLLLIDQLTVAPDMGEAVRAQRLKAAYSLALAKGTVVGTLSMQDRKSGLRVDGTLQGVQLPDLAALTRPLQRDVQGVLAGSFDGVLRFTPSVSVKELNAKVRVENGRLALKQPVLGNTVLPFAQVSATLALKGQQLQLTEGMVDSKLFAGAFTGEVRLRKDFPASALAVKGNLQPRPELFKGVAGKAAALQAVRMQFKDRPLPFRLSGDLRAPAIHFEEFAVLLKTLEKESK